MDAVLLKSAHSLRRALQRKRSASHSCQENVRIDDVPNLDHRHMSVYQQHDDHLNSNIARALDTDSQSQYNASTTTSIRRFRRSRSLHSGRLRPLRSRPSSGRPSTSGTNSTSSWTEDATTLAAETPIEPLLPDWTLKLPDAVLKPPSLMAVTQDELLSRGVILPRPTFEIARGRPSHTARPSLARTVSVRSVLSNFVPHPCVRPLLYADMRHEGTAEQRVEPQQYPTGLALALIIIGICLSVFIISLDRGIITTAIPSIVVDFQSYNDIAWYGSAYLLTASSFQPLYGRIYTSFDIKWSFLGAVATFEVGSLLCAAAPHSKALIVGRAVQGLGSAGVLTGSFVVGTHSVPLAQRPILFAFVGVLYGVGALCGPMLGGVFSELLNWRWCFYINLPIGVLTFISVLCFFRPDRPASNTRPALSRRITDSSTQGSTFLHRLRALDWIGNTLYTSACTFLFLALQWSQERSSDWSSARCISTISIAGVIFVSFAIWLCWNGDEALIPLRILRQRTVAVSCASAFLIYGALLIHTYYLPIWFQAIKNTGALQSGVNMIPYMLTNAFCSLAAGIFVSKMGLFAPPAILGCGIATVGAGLLATMHLTTTTATWAGFQVLVSAGLGMAIQQGFSAVQATLPLHEVAIGTAAVVSCQSAGGAIFVSVGNTLLQNHLFNANQANTIPGVNIRAVVELGATQFRNFVPAESLPALLELYNDALQAVFISAVPLCGMAFFCTLFMEWRNIAAAPTEGTGTLRDLETGTRPSVSSPNLGSDAPTLAHLAPRARARWSQKWKRPRDEFVRPVVRLDIVPELNISEKTLAPFEIRETETGTGFLAGEMKEVEVQVEAQIEKDIGRAIST